jgi:hypothetical protein
MRRRAVGRRVTRTWAAVRAVRHGGAASAAAGSAASQSITLTGESAAARSRGRVSRTGSGTTRKLPPRRLGRATLPVLAGFALLTLLALGVPVGSSIYWMFEGGAHAITGASLPAAAMTTGGYGMAAAALDTVLALAMPGVVAAFALSYFTEHYAAGFGYQSAPLLVGCYAIMFFPLARGGQGVFGPGPGEPGRHGPLAGPQAGPGPAAGDAAARRTRPRRGLLPGVPVHYANALYLQIRTSPARRIERDWLG